MQVYRPDNNLAAQIERSIIASNDYSNPVLFVPDSANIMWY